MKKAKILHSIGKSRAVGLWRKSSFPRRKKMSLLRGAIACVTIPCEASRLRVGKNCYIGVTEGAELTIGNSVVIYDNARINVDAPGAKLSIGDHSALNSGAQIFCGESVTIGNFSGLGLNGLLTDSDMHDIEGQKSSAPVVIEDYVWIGANVTILKGVTIHSGAMVAAGSVVTKDVPPGMLVAGNPAKPIREIKFEF